LEVRNWSDVTDRRITPSDQIGQNSIEPAHHDPQIFTDRSVSESLTRDLQQWSRDPLEQSGGFECDVEAPPGDYRFGSHKTYGATGSKDVTSRM